MPISLLFNLVAYINRTSTESIVQTAYYKAIPLISKIALSLMADMLRAEYLKSQRSCSPLPTSFLKQDFYYVVLTDLELGLQTTQTCSDLLPLLPELWVYGHAHYLHFFLLDYMYVCIYVEAHAIACICGGQEAKLGGFDFLLSPSVFWGLNSGCQACHLYH